MKHTRMSPQMILLVIVLLILGPGEAFLNGGLSGVADWLIGTLLMLPGIVVGLSFHEYAHAKVADLCGDPTPRLQGRVTLDPRAHIDPVGLVSLIFIHFGWGKPVVIAPENFRHGKRDRIFVGLAGVTMNLLLAIAFGGVFSLLVRFSGSFITTRFGFLLGQILIEIVLVNFSLMLFNLLPIPPLDGFGVITDLFNLQDTKFYDFAMRYSTLILLVLILFRIPSRLLSGALWSVTDFLMSTIYRLPGWSVFLY